MDRDERLTAEGEAFVRELDALVQHREQRRLPVTSWLAALPDHGFTLSVKGLRRTGPSELHGLRSR